jgi:hypothetical protein
MVLVQIDEGFHTRKMKSDGTLFQAKKLGFAFYILKSTSGEFLGRHLAKIVEELSEAVGGKAT